MPMLDECHLDYSGRASWEFRAAATRDGAKAAIRMRRDAGADRRSPQQAICVKGEGRRPTDRDDVRSVTSQCHAFHAASCWHAYGLPAAPGVIVRANSRT